MEPALYPEVLQDIIRQLCADKEGTIDDKRDLQANLASVMNTSQVSLSCLDEDTYRTWVWLIKPEFQRTLRISLVPRLRRLRSGIVS
jgi:hypothetical protein